MKKSINQPARCLVYWSLVEVCYKKNSLSVIYRQQAVDQCFLITADWVEPGKLSGLFYNYCEM